MIEIGRINTLTALRETSVGFFLNEPHGHPDDDVLLPTKYVPEGLHVEDEIDVFIYTDSEDRPIATTLTPAVMRGQFASLECVAVTNAGAFLAWGLEKDLLVPHREQSRPMSVGQWYVVFVYLDETTDRLVASSKVGKFLDPDVQDLYEGDEVQLLAYERTDLGLNVIINNRYKGLIYANEIFRIVRPNAERILATLKAEGGFLPLTDYSEPGDIYKLLEMSKKTFKKAIGTLYKDRLITLEKDGIRLVN